MFVCLLVNHDYTQSVLSHGRRKKTETDTMKFFETEEKANERKKMEKEEKYEKTKQKIEIQKHILQTH